MKKTDEYLHKLRHSSAHLLAAAILELWPEAIPTIGPAIENGFYYDFDNLKISDSDLPKIEQKMLEIAKTWKQFEKMTVTSAEAKDRVIHNIYKQEILEEIIKERQDITFYKAGDFVDLCRGGHCDHPNQELKHFKLLSIAGAYWRGSEKNKMLTRIYGTAFPTKPELDAYLVQREEAKKRDHRKLGKELELFLYSPSVGSGFPLYMPRGFIIKRELERWIMDEKEKRGYQFVWTPHVAKSELYKQSGHWQKYDAMMNPMDIDGEKYVVKPMNCPHHFQIYNERPRSYRQLPLRIAENATVYRFEKAGEVNGLLRVRSLTMDDTHIFVRHEQIDTEIDSILDLAMHIYKTLGFWDFSARISVRDPKNPDKYLGSSKTWDLAEKTLVAAVKKRNMAYFVGEGEAAFYGPKIDIVVKDAIGRDWQLTTCQLDFVQPENFSMRYTDEHGNEASPAVLHVAILGSVDRFMGILIEHFAGVFPLWLAPVHAVIIPIAERHNEEAKKIADKLKSHGLRIELDDRKEPMGAKVRDHTLRKVPYLGIIGDTEIAGNSVSVRTLRGEQLKELPLRDFTGRLTNEIETKANP